MEKITYSQMCEKIAKHNAEHHVTQQYADENPLYCCICYKQSNFKNEYSEASRTYMFRSDEKHFIPEMGGNSIFGDSLDGSDTGVRLDQYKWDIEFCYIVGE